VASHYRHWKLETDPDGLVWLSFDKADASANVLSAEVMAELDAILDELQARSPRGLVIRSGKESGFIAGADIEEFTRLKDADDAMRMVKRGWDLYNKLAALPFPTLALVNGFCMGGGVELAIACRYRIAVDQPGTRFALPEVMLGILPAWGGVMRLPRLVGPTAALDMLLTGRTIDAAEAAALILSWTTAYQLLHRAARVQRGQRVLVQGPAGAFGQALLALSGGWPASNSGGTARGKHSALIHELGATPIDYQREDFTRVLPGGFDVVFDGIGEDGYRRSFAALKRGGLLCAYGYSAGVQAQRHMLTILMWMARLYLWRWLPGGKRARVYSINVMRARHSAWFREDLERLFGLLATRAIWPRVAERISFDEVAEAHRRLEAGGLEGKLVLCPELPSRRDRVPLQH